MIYLDNNASTRLDPVTAEEMLQLSDRASGNPGSRHAAGRAARQILEEAREIIAGILEAHPEEVLFTSGGTESNNLAVFGLAGDRQGDIFLPGGEHPSVEEPVRRLLARGCRRVELTLTSTGRLSHEGVLSLDYSAGILATAILAHNETGVIQNLEPLAARCAEAGVPLHVDAVQAAGKIDVSFRRLEAATLSVASHKFHGPRGVGALLVRRDCRLRPLLVGGHQERGLRSGTEPALLAWGMASALRRWHQQREERCQYIESLRDRLQQGLLAACAPAVINGDPEYRLPNTLHIAFPGCPGEALLVNLDLEKVCASLGSACASGSLEPAPVLLAMGLPPEISGSALRLSLSHQNTAEEIESAITIIARVVRRLRRQNSEARP